MFSSLFYFPPSCSCSCFTKASTTLVIILPSVASRTRTLWKAVPFIVGAKPTIIVLDLVLEMLTYSGKCWIWQKQYGLMIFKYPRLVSCLINTKQSRLLDSIRFFEMNQDFLLIVNQLVIIDERYQLPNGYR